MAADGRLSLKDIDPETLALAEKAARAAGLSVEEWIARAILRRAGAQAMATRPHDVPPTSAAPTEPPSPDRSEPATETIPERQIGFQPVVHALPPHGAPPAAEATAKPAPGQPVPPAEQPSSTGPLSDTALLAALNALSTKMDQAAKPSQPAGLIASSPHVEERATHTPQPEPAERSAPRRLFRPTRPSLVVASERPADTAQPLPHLSAAAPVKELDELKRALGRIASTPQGPPVAGTATSLRDAEEAEEEGTLRVPAAQSPAQAAEAEFGAAQVPTEAAALAAPEVAEPTKIEKVEKSLSDSEGRAAQTDKGAAFTAELRTPTARRFMTLREAGLTIEGATSPLELTEEVKAEPLPSALTLSTPLGAAPAGAVEPVPEGGRRGSRWLGVAAGVLALGGVATGLYYWFGEDDQLLTELSDLYDKAMNSIDALWVPAEEPPAATGQAEPAPPPNEAASTSSPPANQVATTQPGGTAASPRDAEEGAPPAPNEAASAPQPPAAPPKPEAQMPPPTPAAPATTTEAPAPGDAQKGETAKPEVLPPAIAVVPPAPPVRPEPAPLTAALPPQKPGARGDAASAPLANKPGDSGTRAPATVKELEELAKKGVPSAEHDLGILYARGDEVPKDYAQAAHWFRESALKGIADSQFNLGVMYEQGLGVQKDPLEALLWYLSAAEQGYPPAEYNVGTAYAEGKGIPKNDGEARKWFAKSAQHGLAVAALNLGVLYEDGRGGSTDLAEAYKWYRIAARDGYAGAEKYLNELRAKASPSVVAEGDRRFDRASASIPTTPSLQPDRGGAPPARVSVAEAKNQPDTPAHKPAVAHPAHASSPSPPAPGATAHRAEPNNGTGSSSDVAEIQRLLDTLGYEPGPSTGIVTPKTTAAIRTFQQEAGIPVDGKATSDLLQYLKKLSGRS
jgi:localization factor PodJL